MIRVSQIKLEIHHKEQELKKKTAKLLRIPAEDITDIHIVKRSVDARKKEQIFFVYTVDAAVKQEENVLKRSRSSQIAAAPEEHYHFPQPGSQKLSHKPIIIGTGPAGLFCGLMLARAGYRPILLERGDAVDVRKEKVERFWKGEALDTESNVQFGEGGAGTFSDGKLNTLVKDPSGRNRLVLRIFAEFGADESILYQHKPHIGTDVLSQIVKSMREEIVSHGGQVRFGCKVTDLQVQQGQIKGVVLERGEIIAAETVVLAIGHSARDTFSMLLKHRVPMEQKAFAVGLRIQHPQQMINRSQYGSDEAADILGAADYKLTHQCAGGRGVYSFCMCPGGYVVNASSEQERLAINGMSNHARDGANANSALIVTVTPEDFPDAGPLGGVEFQRRLEEAAYRLGNGAIPIQLYQDFKENRESTKFGKVTPEFCGLYRFANIQSMLPEYLSEALIEGIEAFNNKIKGFSMGDAVLAGMESRTSSPVRIHRNDEFESEIRGLYPCGEGAGYAGGITSAAMDGIKVAEALAARFAPAADSGCGSFDGAGKKL